MNQQCNYKWPATETMSLCVATRHKMERDKIPSLSISDLHYSDKRNPIKVQHESNWKIFFQMLGCTKQNRCNQIITAYEGNTDIGRKSRDCTKLPEILLQFDPRSRHEPEGALRLSVVSWLSYGHKVNSIFWAYIRPYSGSTYLCIILGHGHMVKIWVRLVLLIK